MSSAPPPLPVTTAPAPAPVGAAATAASGAPSKSTAKSGAAPKPKKKKAGASASAKGGGAGGGDGAAAPPKPKPPRKKKSTPKASAASRQALLHDAKQAEHDLQLHRALMAARKSDPLWYKIEDVLPAIHESKAMVGKTSILPEQLQVVENALRQTGLQRSDLTPQAMACVLEQARRYALELLTDAQDYAHAAHPSQETSKADLLLAADMRADHPVAISTQLPKLNLVASQINRAPLPSIPNHCYSGILLPPQEHQLTARTYDVIHASQVSRRMVQETPHLHQPPSTTTTTATPSSKEPPSATAAPHPLSSTSSSSYGASRGRQIPIKLRDETVAATAAETTKTATAAATASSTPPGASASGTATSSAPATSTTPEESGDVTMTDA